MMEDNSEAQMETDVSSTTTDIPEKQEATGSKGSVEMVIVIEQIKDEDVCTFQKESDLENGAVTTCVQPTQCSEDTNQIERPSSQTPTLTNPIEDKQSDEATGPKEASPDCVESTPTKLPEQSTTQVISKSPLNTISSSMPVQPMEVMADSSSKEMHYIQDKGNNNPEKELYLEPCDTISNCQSAEDHPMQIKQSGQSAIAKEIETQNIELPSNSCPNDASNKLLYKNIDVKDTETTMHVDTPEKEISNDSQSEITSDGQDKDHHKSISRELKSLIKSAKESKIISECNQLTSKTRKSRTLDNANTSLSSLVEAEKIQGVRRSSNNSQKSNCSEKSDKATVKRSMRSQNPEFVNKVKQFLNSVTGKGNKAEADSVMSEEDLDESKIEHNDSKSPTKKKKIIEDQDSDKKNKCDSYCWRCHWSVEQSANEKTHHPMQCTICPRAFHYKCLSGTERNKITTEKNWVCPECLSVLHAESSETRSPAMKKISLGLLCELLKYALERLMDLNGVDPFMQPVDLKAFPDYEKYVVHPMDLSLMKNNINEGLYGSTEAFLADTQWILHNSIIFNTLQSKLTCGARALVRMCRAEMGEIEACPECYAAAHARRPTWFTDVCSSPHILLWAKLKGFPHWPAKGMSVNGTGLVDVRFFGAHDRAWVPAKDCYLYSEKDPNNFRTKRQDILDSMQEAEQHIRNISRKYGKFVYPPFKTQFDPTKLTEQLKLMIPSFEGEVSAPMKDKSGGTPHRTGKGKSRSNSKSSKSSLQDGDISEGEDVSMTRTRKMADGAEIAQEEEDFSINDKSVAIDAENEPPKNDSTRKRRRSELEEAVITILDNSNSETAEKRKRGDKIELVVVKNGELKEKVSQDKPTEETEAANETAETTKTADSPSSSANDKEKSIEPTTPKILPKVKAFRTSTPKDKDNVKDRNNSEEFPIPKPQKPSRSDKSLEKEDKSKSEKRKNSKNKSINSNTDKNDGKNTEKSVDNPTSTKDVKEANSNNMSKDNEADQSLVKTTELNTDDQKLVKNRIQFDDDISLAIIARQAKHNVMSNNISGLPTISSVRSLSITPNNETSHPKTSNPPTSVEINIEVIPGSSISTYNVHNVKEAVTKQHKPKPETEPPPPPPPIGRVGVRAFARMPSFEVPLMDKEPIQVEIKAEPIDLDDSDRHNEKMDLMNAFKLRPVNPPPANNLREVRINKVVSAPASRKSTTKPQEVRVRAKKTFPQPKKVDESRSELNSKNSMVYIPIQPPVTQAPVRGVRPPAPNCPANTSNVRLSAPIIPSANGINALTTPLVPHTMSIISNSSPATTNTCNVLSTMPTAGQVPNTGQISSGGQVATTVHTVPLLTSLNGQWTFSLQPVMSVGGLDEPATSVLNGLTERGSSGSLVTLGGQRKSLTSPMSQNASGSVTTLPTPVSGASSTPGNRNDTPGELPRLLQRPPLLNPFDASTPMGCVPAPSSAGPLTARLNQNAVKLTDFFRTLLEDSLEKIDEPITQVATAKLKLEQAKWMHQQEINEIKHNHDLMVAEIKASFEKEKIRAVNDVRRAAQTELEAAVKLAKSKQWCANCSQEAQFYCCWNTSYCDYPCQRAHWCQHFSVCTQQRKDSDVMEIGAPSQDSQRPTDVLPKSAPAQAPTLAVGTQLAPLRVFSQEPQTIVPKPSILVSMVEDASGNQTMKCVGTYKPPPALSAININKQIITSDEGPKKGVTSGGYLIVSASTATTANIVTSRRAPTIQYYT